MARPHGSARTPWWSASTAPSPRCRRDEYPEYKAGRAEKSAELVDQLAGAVDLLRACGFAVVQHEGWEADDVLSSAAALARDRGWRCTVVTSDRDSFALIDETTSVLRIIAGGVDASPLLTPARLPLLCGVRAGQYRDYAALRGDVSDNLPGANGHRREDGGQAAGSRSGASRTCTRRSTAVASRRSWRPSGRPRADAWPSRRRGPT